MKQLQKKNKLSKKQWYEILKLQVLKADMLILNQDFAQNLTNQSSNNIKVITRSKNQNYQKKKPHLINAKLKFLAIANKSHTMMRNRIE